MLHDEDGRAGSLVSEECGRTASPWPGLALALLFLAVHTVYVVTIGADVAYMDSLRYIGYYFDRPWDIDALARFWNQGDHRGLLSQLVLWLNIRVLGMNMLVANVLTGFVLLASALTLFLAYLRFAAVRGVTPGASTRLRVLFVFLAVFFSLAGFELYTLDLGLPENLRNGLFLALACWLLQRDRTLGTLGCACLVMALLLVMLLSAYGRIYAFAGALVTASLLAVLRHEWQAGRAALMCTLAAVVVSLMGYVGLGAALPHGLGNTGLQDVTVPAVLRGILLGAASTVIGVDVADHLRIPMIMLACTGAALLAVLIWVGGRYLATVRGRGAVVPVFLVAYGAINLLAVAVSRGSEPLGTMASRYYADFCWLLLGLVWMLVAGVLESPKTRASTTRRWLLGVGCMLILCGYGVTQATEAMIWPYRVAAFDAMRQASLVCGKVPEGSVALLQANNQEILQHAIDLQRRYRLGVWRHHAPSCTQ